MEFQAEDDKLMFEVKDMGRIWAVVEAFRGVGTPNKLTKEADGKMG